MSYDVALLVDTGGEEPTEVTWRNHTSNTSRMWRQAGCDIADFDGKPATEFHAALTVAIQAISSDPLAYSDFEPENRWGTVTTTLAFLRQLQADCAAHPEAVVEVSR